MVRYQVRIVKGLAGGLSRSKSKDPKYLGKGGQGCVVQPAIVFEKPTNEVTLDGNMFYVTKLGRAKDMKEEFDKSKVIQERSPDAGVQLPLDTI